jgi:ATP-binding cassette, subfamily C (CFTR/MRP), member 1
MTTGMKGTVTLSGNCGYAAQQSWIKNATIRENILFGLEFDETRYLTTIRDCALERDLEMFDDGDLTQIGERGINLSGGQKQRINLARAVYYNADIVLMDDPLSAVDAHVGKHLFEECIGGALKSKTRILVTHQLHFLPKVDYILVMKNGTIAEQGAYQELLQAKGEFSQLIQNYNGDTAEKQQAEENVAEIIVSSDGNDIERIKKMLEVKHEIAARNLMKDEERQTGHVSVDVWIRYMNANGGVLFFITVIFMLAISQATSIGTNVWLAIWSDNSIPSFRVQDYILAFFGWSIAQALILYLTMLYFAWYF